MPENISIKKLVSIEEMLPQHQLITQLTPALAKDEYERLLKIMVPNNYFQVAVYENDRSIAVSGYWLCAKLYSGKYMEIDNFVVADGHRSKGIGKLLTDWLTEEAKANDCKAIMLDAYVENFKAHHFYYREGFIARGFHYIKYLP
jgi:GNAT superfamily N-acetyltransferase